MTFVPVVPSTLLPHTLCLSAGCSGSTLHGQTAGLELALFSNDMFPWELQATPTPTLSLTWQDCGARSLWAVLLTPVLHLPGPIQQ